MASNTNRAALLFNSSIENFNMNFNLAPHTTYAVCGGWSSSLTMTSNNRFWKIFHDNFLFNIGVFARRLAKRTYFMKIFCFSYFVSSGIFTLWPIHYILSTQKFMHLTSTCWFNVFSVIIIPIKCNHSNLFCGNRFFGGVHIQYKSERIVIKVAIV